VTIRERLRSSATVSGAFLRLDIVEELSYPMTTVFRLFSALVPVLIYFFQARYLDVTTSYGSTLVGVSVAAAMQAALTGFGGRLQLVQDRGQLEAILVEPVSWRTIPLSMNLWRTTTGLWNTALMLVIGVALGAQLRPGGILPFIGILLLGVVACNAVGILSASLLVLAKRAEPVLQFYGLAASLLGGMLFSVEVLPSWLRPFSYLVPHSYVISGSRALLLGESGGIPLEICLLGLLVFDVVVLGLGLALFARSLQYARRMGLLSGY
jgi:ABC-2 type transport system permease protein